MPTVSAPLFSLHAHGTYRRALVFGLTLGRDIVRSHVTPKDPRTAGQLAARQRLTEAAASWRTLDQQTRDDWNNAAQLINLTGYAYHNRHFILQQTPAGQHPSIP